MTLKEEREKRRDHRVIEYLLSDNVGMSSRSMINQYYKGDKNKNSNHPWDMGDLTRCFLAYEALGLNDINFMKEVSDKWGKLVDFWDELEYIFHDEGIKKPDTYKLLQEILK